MDAPDQDGSAVKTTLKLGEELGEPIGAVDTDIDNRDRMTQDEHD